MDRDRAIEYINELLNSEYDLMQDRKLDTSNPSLYDDEATESEIDEIVNAQEFMDKETAKSRWSVSMEGQLYDFGSCYLCWGNENDE